MDSAEGRKPPHESIRRGFVWLGAASVVARILDTCSVLVVMWFVSRAQIGVATLAWSAAVFLEAMNGLGLNAALLQASDLTVTRLTAAFWYTMAVATALVLVVTLGSPAFARWYGEPALAPMLIVATTKLWFVGAALIPLNQLNRATRFESIAAISTLATLGSGVLTCTLAAAGYQAWSLVLGQVSHGLFTCVGANLAHPFRPRGAPQFGLIRGDVAFGLKAASASILYHFYRNADYYLIGRLLGTSAVGVYRVAFDLAMTPTLSVLTVVNRSALPVYARLGRDPAALKDAFLWTLRSLGILLAPVTALLLFFSEELLGLVDGGKWLDAAPMVRWLALAAFVRSLAQAFPQLFYALKRPLLALYESLFTMVALIGMLYASLAIWGSRVGPVAAAWAWAALAPLSLGALALAARGLMAVDLLAIARTFGPALGAGAAMTASYVLYQTFASHLPALLAAPIGIALVTASFVLYVRHVLGVRLTSLSSPRAA